MGREAREMRHLARVTGWSCVALLWACSGGSGPKGVLSRFLDTSLQGRYREAYVFLSSSDRSVRAEEEFESLSGGDPLVRVLSEKTKYTIDEVNAQAGKATAKVAFKEPNAEDIRKALFEGASGPPTDWNVESARALLAEKYKDGDLPMASRTQEYTLIQEPAGWRVFFNWEAAKRVSELLAQAGSFEASGNLPVAHKKYGEILEVDPAHALALAKRAELDARIREAEEMSAYLPNVALVGETEVSNTAKGYPALFGEVKNGGGRSLDLVEISVIFLDAGGAHIGELRRYSVVAPPGAGGATDAPLPAGASRPFGVPLPDAPAGWSRKFEIQVTNASFTK